MYNILLKENQLSNVSKGVIYDENDKVQTVGCSKKVDARRVIKKSPLNNGKNPTWLGLRGLDLKIPCSNLHFALDITHKP